MLIPPGALLSWNRPVVEQAIVQHNRLLRRLLYQHGGYESREHNGSFLLAFTNADAAVLWSMAVQVRNLIATNLLAVQLEQYAVRHRPRHPVTTPTDHMGWSQHPSVLTDHVHLFNKLL